MPPFGGRPSVGAYVCPRGVFAVECRRTRAGLQIERTFDVPAQLDTPAEAADHLTRVLSSAHVARANVFVALRGFGLVHHILQLPPASAELLTPIVEREVRRLEPQLVDATTAWTALSASTLAESPDTHSAQLAAAVPTETVAAFETRLRQEGHTLAHITAAPAAMLRIAEEFDRSDDVSAIVAALPDGAFLGFFLGGALRLVVEPPVHPDAPHDATALAEEAELGAMFVRQQFRGARLDRMTIIGAVDAVDDAEAMLSGRLGVPVQRFSLRDLSAATHVAVGAVLDAGSSTPLSLGGLTRGRAARRAARTLHSASLAAALVALLLGAWTVLGAVQARRAADDLTVARRRIQQDSFGLATVRATADERKLIRDAQAALRFVAADRAELQQTIGSVAAAMSDRIRVDSIGLRRTMEGWAVAIGGVAPGLTSAHAVQSLHDFYQELPRRLAVNDLSLERLSYVDSTSGGSAVRFELSFAAPTPSGRKN